MGRRRGGWGAEGRGEGQVWGAEDQGWEGEGELTMDLDEQASAFYAVNVLLWITFSKNFKRVI